MLVAEIARRTSVKPSQVRQFCSDHDIPRQRKHGEVGVFVDVDAYIAELRKRRYHSEADALERQKEVS